MSKNLFFLIHGLQRALVRATGQFARENVELLIIVNEEIDSLREFHKRQTKQTRAVAAREWNNTVRAVQRHCPVGKDIPNPFEASE